MACRACVCNPGKAQTKFGAKTIEDRAKLYDERMDSIYKIGEPSEAIAKFKNALLKRFKPRDLNRAATPASSVAPLVHAPVSTPNAEAPPVQTPAATPLAAPPAADVGESRTQLTPLAGRQRKPPANRKPEGAGAWLRGWGGGAQRGGGSGDGAGVSMPASSSTGVISPVAMA